MKVLEQAAGQKVPHVHEVNIVYGRRYAKPSGTCTIGAHSCYCVCRGQGSGRQAWVLRKLVEEDAGQELVMIMY